MIEHVGMNIFCFYDGGQQYLINKISPLRTTCHAHVDQRFKIWQVIW